MTPPPGHIRPDGHGGLRVIIEETEHLVTADDAASSMPAISPCSRIPTRPRSSGASRAARRGMSSRLAMTAT